jgi:hypothetical protein
VARERVANILLASRGRGAAGAQAAAQQLARLAARDALGPLLEATCARLAAVVLRSYDVAAEQALAQKGKISIHQSYILSFLS